MCRNCDGWVDLPSVVWFPTKIVKSARKEHKCVECEQLIGVGESYERLVYLLDGELKSDKQHYKYCPHYSEYER